MSGLHMLSEKQKPAGDSEYSPASVFIMLPFSFQRGEVACVRRRCPTVSCTHPALDGCACGICDGCNFNGKDCFNGERFPHPSDRCQRCSCLVPQSFLYDGKFTVFSRLSAATLFLLITQIGTCSCDIEEVLSLFQEAFFGF